MKYKSQREKIKEFFDFKILPKFNSDPLNILDYKKTISIIAGEIGTSETLVEDVLKSYIQSGILIEERTLILSEEKIKEIEKFRRNIIDVELKEAGLK